MARKTKIYKVICVTTYSNIKNSYTAFQSHYKKECNHFVKNRCRQTPTRVYYIDEDFIYID